MSVTREYPPTRHKLVGHIFSDLASAQRVVVRTPALGRKREGAARDEGRGKGGVRWSRQEPAWHRRAGGGGGGRLDRYPGLRTRVRRGCTCAAAAPTAAATTKRSAHACSAHRPARQAASPRRASAPSRVPAGTAGCSPRAGGWTATCGRGARTGGGCMLCTGNTLTKPVHCQRSQGSGRLPVGSPCLQQRTFRGRGRASRGCTRR